jgi:protein involved in polysaccharide export with SLBB domain
MPKETIVPRGNRARRERLFNAFAEVEVTRLTPPAKHAFIKATIFRPPFRIFELPRMKFPIFLFSIGVGLLSASAPFGSAQDVPNLIPQDPATFFPQDTPKSFDAPAATGPESVSNTVAYTNSMAVLNDQTKLGNGDTVSYRVVEERKEPIAITITDSGEMEVPYIGRVQAAGKTCKQVAMEIKPLLEKDYFYKATVIIGLSTLSTRSRGRVYLMGEVRTQGAMEIPPDETLTVSKVILRAGGLGDFANRHKVKLVRKTADGKTQTTIVDLAEVLDKGHSEKDPEVMPNDLIIVPERLINF